MCMSKYSRNRSNELKESGRNKKDSKKKTPKERKHEKSRRTKYREEEFWPTESPGAYEIYCDFIHCPIFGVFFSVTIKIHLIFPFGIIRTDTENSHILHMDCLVQHKHPKTCMHARIFFSRHFCRLTLDWSQVEEDQYLKEK